MIIRVKVQPRSSLNALKALPGDEWKLYLTAPPVDGKANQACVEFFARSLRIPRAGVRIVSGQTSRQKIIELEGVSESQLRKIAD